MNRDEYLIFPDPKHTVAEYTRAHQLAGRLELEKPCVDCWRKRVPGLIRCEEHAATYDTGSK